MAKRAFDSYFATNRLMCLRLIFKRASRRIQTEEPLRLIWPPHSHFGHPLATKGFAAGSLGLPPGDAGALEKLIDGLGRPFLALLGPHWVIVYGHSGGMVDLRDPWGESGPGSTTGVEAQITALKFLKAFAKEGYTIVAFR